MHSHTASSIGTDAGHSTATPPTIVAAPLPPRKPCHSGQTCPTVAANAVAYASQAASACGAKRSPSHAASAPLPMSIAITPSANFAPCVRKALVPPALPLPWVRISTPRSFPSSRLPESEPSRYAAKISSGVVIG